jgi:signal transduction histidine kinase
MKRRIPLSLKLGLSFAFVIVVSIGLVYFMTSRSLTARFAEYRRDSLESWVNLYQELLANYYQKQGSWAGVYDLFFVQVDIKVGDESFAGLSPLIGGHFSLANEEGTVIISTKPGDMWQPVSAYSADEAYLAPIVVDSVQVGTLILDYGGSMSQNETNYLASVTNAALLGGAVAIALGIGLSIFLIMQILSPLRKLSRATEQIAGGESPQSVSIHSRDELGELGESFNHMVESLRQSETARQTMTADIAHELRTPVTIIQGVLEALLDRVYEASDETVATLYEETLHLGRLIDDLRELAMAEAGELHLDKEPVNVVALARQVAEIAGASSEDTPEIHIEAKDDVPEIQADPKRLRQVLANLLSNALHYTPRDGQIRIEIERTDGEVEIAIVDTGTGISEDDLPHLFERFYRGDPARNREGGTGLGLAIAKQWVEAHGGRIWAVSQLGQGARFCLRLPLA